VRACLLLPVLFFFFFSSRRRHTRFSRDWSSDVCSSDLEEPLPLQRATCVRRLHAHRTGQSYPAGARAYVVLMLTLDLPDLPTQVVPQRRGQDRDAAVAALAAAHRDLPAIEVDVLRSEER